MNLYFKLIFACILGGILALTVKKNSPEIAVLIGVCIVISTLIAAAEMISDLKSQFQSIELLTYLPKETFLPLLKCIAISVLTQISCALCKDCGQTAVAYGLEFTGSIVLILCMMPLIAALFQLIGGIL